MANIEALPDLNQCAIELDATSLSLIQHHALLAYKYHAPDDVEWRHLNKHISVNDLFGSCLLPFHGVQALAVLEFIREDRYPGFDVASKDKTMLISFNLARSPFCIVEIARILAWGAVQLARKAEDTSSECHLHELVLLPLLGPQASLVLSDLNLNVGEIWQSLCVLKTNKSSADKDQ